MDATKFDSGTDAPFRKPKIASIENNRHTHGASQGETERGRYKWCSKSPVAIWFCVAVGECGLALSFNNRTPDLKSPGHFLRIVPFNFDRVSQYLPRSIDGSNLQKSTQKTVLAKNKIVLDPALRLQSFRTPKTQQLVSEVGLNANNKSDGGPVPDSSRKIDRQHECQYGRNEIELTGMNANMGEMKSDLTASMNANMTEMKSS
ncbi:hypothetical protein TNCV_1095261 [Trichonephila clavipes]|nr:hypothetical protein TNCV_1095261 [Trichonephila clavipes]